MKNYLNTFTKKKQTNTDTQTNGVLMASDDVRRIAQRNPSLFQTKSVPRVGGFHMEHTGSGGLI